MSENVDYSFMKSGFDNTDTSHIDQAKNVTAIMVHFTENAMNTAAIYANHAKRREIVSEDIKRALMMEVFFFQKRNNLEEKIVGKALTYIVLDFIKANKRKIE